MEERTTRALDPDLAADGSAHRGREAGLAPEHRVTALASLHSEEPRDHLRATVEGHAELRVPAPADGEGHAHLVEILEGDLDGPLGIGRPEDEASALVDDAPHGDRLARARREAALTALVAGRLQLGATVAREERHPLRAVERRGPEGRLEPPGGGVEALHLGAAERAIEPDEPVLTQQLVRIAHVDRSELDRAPERADREPLRRSHQRHAPADLEAGAVEHLDRVEHQRVGAVEPQVQDGAAVVREGRGRHGEFEPVIAASEQDQHAVPRLEGQAADVDAELREALPAQIDRDVVPGEVRRPGNDRVPRRQEDDRILHAGAAAELRPVPPLPRALLRDLGLGRRHRANAAGTHVAHQLAGHSDVPELRAAESDGLADHAGELSQVALGPHDGHHVVRREVRSRLVLEQLQPPHPREVDGRRPPETIAVEDELAALVHREDPRVDALVREGDPRTRLRNGGDRGERRSGRHEGETQTDHRS